MNYYLKESSEIFLLKYLKYTKITIFVIISPKLEKKPFKAKKSTKKHIKKQLVKKKHKKAHVLFKSTLYEHCELPETPGFMWTRHRRLVSR